MESLDAASGVQYFKQTADIPMSGVTWTPFDFDGHFDGNGKKIRGVKIDQPGDNVGFFSILTSNGKLENVHLEDVNIKGNNYVGGLVGSVASGGSITNSSATANLKGNGHTVGGLVGSVASGGSITNSSASGSVNGSSQVGGLVGFSSGSITNSSASGSVTGSNYYVGGLVGFSSGSITNSYASGSVTSTGSSFAGGLVGCVDSGNITNSYATGLVTGAGNVGGLVGYKNGSVSSSYYDSVTTGQSDTGKGDPRTTTEMKEGTPTTIYLGWDPTIWDFGTTADYPTLWVSTPVTGITAITGTPQVGNTLTAGSVTPAGATVTYQWQIATTAGGPYADIAGATSNTYTPVAGDAGKFIKVVVTGTGSYTGKATSDATLKVTPQ